MALRFKNFKSWREEKDGQATILFGLSLSVFIGATAYTVDLGQIHRSNNHLLTTAEAAAMAAAMEIPNRTVATQTSLAIARDNQDTDVFIDAVTAPDIQYGEWDPASETFTETDTGYDVKVTASLNEVKGNSLSAKFGIYFGYNEYELSEFAIAGRSGSGLSCIIALNPSLDKSLYMSSNATISYSGCDIGVESISQEGFVLDSNSAVISAGRVCVRGQTVINNNSYITPPVLNGCSPGGDPFETLPPPEFNDQSCDHHNKSFKKGHKIAYPGVYCGGIRVKSNTKVTFSPGVYIIKDGPLDFDSNTEIVGHGVGFYLTGNDGLLNFDSNAEVDFSAPATGDMQGLIFFQDRDFGGTHKFDSNTVNDLGGAIYLPSAELEINSNAKIDRQYGCTRIIADNIVMDSNIDIDVNKDFSNCPGGEYGLPGNRFVSIKK